MDTLLEVKETRDGKFDIEIWLDCNAQETYYIVIPKEEHDCEAEETVVGNDGYLHCAKCNEPVYDRIK